MRTKIRMLNDISLLSLEKYLAKFLGWLLRRHIHVYDQYDYDSGDLAEYGHCIECGHWIDTATGADETLRSEKEEE